MKQKISPRESKSSWNPLDLFLILLVLLAVLSAYFTLVHPLPFSGLIKREAVQRYLEMEIVLHQDLYWMKDSLPVGEEKRGIYGEMDWKVLQIWQEKFGGREVIKMRLKILVNQDAAEVFRYGSLTLAKGCVIQLRSPRYLIEGRIVNFKPLEEKHPI